MKKKRELEEKELLNGRTSLGSKICLGQGLGLCPGGSKNSESPPTFMKEKDIPKKKNPCPKDFLIEAKSRGIDPQQKLLNSLYSSDPTDGRRDYPATATFHHTFSNKSKLSANSAATSISSTKSSPNFVSNIQKKSDRTSPSRSDAFFSKPHSPGLNSESKCLRFPSLVPSSFLPGAKYNSNHDTSKRPSTSIGTRQPLQSHYDAMDHRPKTSVGRTKRNQFGSSNHIQSQDRSSFHNYSLSANMVRDPITFLESKRNSSGGYEFDFIYLVYSKNPKLSHNCMYELTIVSSEETDFSKDYFILSPKGVTLYRSLRTVEFVDFTPLEDWLEEYAMYRKLLESRFYRHHRFRKVFVAWKRLVAKKYVHFRQHLSENLPIASEIFGNALRNIRAICLEISEEIVIPLDIAQVPLYPGQLLSICRTRLSDISGILLEFISNSAKICLQACQLSSEKREMLVSKGYIDVMDTRMRLRNLRRLKYFIRLCQYLVNITLLVIGHNSLTCLLHLVKRSFCISVAENLRSDLSLSLASVNYPDPEFSHDSPLFSLDFMLMEKKIITVPSQKEVLSTLNTICEESIACISSFPLLTEFSPPLCLFMSAYQTTGEKEIFAKLASPVKDTLMSFPSIVRARQNIDECIRESYRLIDTHVKEISPLLSLMETNYGDWHSYLDPEKSEVTPVALLNIREIYRRVDKDIISIQGLKKDVTLKCFRACREDIVEKLLPIPNEALGILHSNLPIIAKNLTEAFTFFLEKNISYLQYIPDNLKETALWVSAAHKLEAEWKISEKTLFVIKSIYALLNEFHICPAEEKNTPNLMEIQLLSLEETLGRSRFTKTRHISAQTPKLLERMTQLNASAEHHRKRLQEEAFLTRSNNSSAVILNLSMMRKEFDLIRSEALELSEMEILFQVPHSNLDEVEQCERELECLQVLWSIVQKSELFRHRLFNLSIFTLDMNEIDVFLQNMTEALKRGSLVMPTVDITNWVEELLDEWKSLVSICVFLRNKALKPRHWKEIRSCLKTFIPNDDALTFQLLLDNECTHFHDHIEEISNTATSEADLEVKLNAIISRWCELEFTVKQEKEFFLISNFAEVTQYLQEDQLILNSMHLSRFCNPFVAQVVEWKQKLSVIFEVVTCWQICQRNWIFLRSIFSSTDVQRQMAHESLVMHHIDRSWKDLMGKLSGSISIQGASMRRGNLETLVRCNRKMEQLFISIEMYLESKRKSFPRLYFLSNTELLSLLSQSRNMDNIIPFIRKVFPHVHSLGMNLDENLCTPNNEIKHVFSFGGEKLELRRPIRFRDAVEDWAGQLCLMLQTTLKRLLEDMLKRKDSLSLDELVKSFPNQLILLFLQIQFCRQIDKILRSNAPTFEQLVDSVRKSLETVQCLLRNKPSSSSHSTLQSILTYFIYQRDIISLLVSCNSPSESFLKWDLQLRYSWDGEGENSSCIVNQSGLSRSYCFEYYGNSRSMILTSEVLNCFNVIAMALKHGFGIACSGSSGSGKTEIIQEYAKSMGMFCLLFSFSHQSFDFRLLAQFLRGTAIGGTWLCLDIRPNLGQNNIAEIFQNVLTLKRAIQNKMDDFVLNEKNCSLNRNCSVFLTYNDDLHFMESFPVNLKTIFRPMSIVVADFEIIAEALLLTEGLTSNYVHNFIQAVEMLSIRSSKISFNNMCFLKKSISLAGSVMRANPSLSEKSVLCSSIASIALPSILENDLAACRTILQNVFLSPPFPLRLSYDAEDSVRDALSQILSENQYDHIPEEIDKILQLWDILRAFKCIIVFGGCSSGKTTAIKVLAKAFQKVANNPFCVDVVRLFTATIPLGGLLGEYDKKPHEYQRGILPTLVDKIILSPQNHSWIVFDGPHDPSIPEVLHPVFEENSCLCLPTGEKLAIPKNVKFFFETTNLKDISPSFIRRCGLVCFDTVNIGWKCLIQPSINRLQQLPEDVKQYLIDLCCHIGDNRTILVSSGKSRHRIICKLRLTCSQK